MKKKFISLFILLTIFVATFAHHVKNQPTTFKQPDGSIVNCFITGDEFFRRFHDENGYTLIEDPDTGFLVYAILENDKLKSSGYKYKSIDPQIIGIKPNIVISKEKYNALREEYFSHDIIMPKSGNMPKSGQNNGAINNIVVFIRFSDQPEYTLSNASVNNMFNSSTPNTVSLYNFFKDISYNQTFVQSHFFPTASGTTVISYKDSHPRNYYLPYESYNNIGYQESEIAAREHQLLADAVAYISNQVPSTLNIDYNNDGYVDNICFVLAGDYTVPHGILWPHKWTLYSQVVYLKNKRIGTYNLQLTSMLDIEVLCHEMYHSFGAPDLYHYSYDYLSPIDAWDIMAYTLPQQSSTNYVKYKYGGWIQDIPEITQNGHYTLKNAMSPTNNCYKIAAPLSTNGEFFVVEYRRNNEFWENSIPESGLLIYKVNPSINGNSGGPPDGIYIYRPGANNMNTNGFPASAAFSANSGRKEFSKTTDPPCFLATGTSGIKENFRIYNISAIATTISFDIEFNTHYLNISSYNANFNNINVNTTSYNHTITISGYYLNDTISVEKIGADANYFTVNKENWDNYHGGTLQINFHPDEVREYNAVIKVYTPEFGIKNILLKGNGIIMSTVADFNCNTQNIWAGKTVQFNDLSTNNPIEWKWTFEGGTPGFSDEKNPLITYNTPGLYYVKLIVFNLNTSDTIIKPQFINVEEIDSNLVCNNGFEYWNNSNSTPNCWFGSKTNSGVTKKSEDVYQGNYSVQISNIFNTPKRFTSKGFQIDAYYEYYVHFYYKGKGNLTVSLFDLRTENNGFSPEDDIVAVDETVWTEFSKTILATNSTEAGQLCFVLSETNSATNHIMIDNVTITRSENQISVNPKTNDEIKIYPNPNNGIFNLTDIQNAKITITDITGKIIYSENNLKNNSKIDLRSFANAIYFIKIEDNNKIFHNKIVLEK